MTTDRSRTPARKPMPERASASTVPEKISESTWRRLVEAATRARENAYAPYSHYPVGAAVLGADRKIHSGCNVENSSYGATFCAERNAVGQAVASGEQRILAAVVLTGSTPPAPPCGICLQTFAEFAGAELPILLVNPAGEARGLSLQELLPHAFGPDDLDGGEAGGD